MFECLIRIIASKNVSTQVLFTFCGLLCVIGWCQWIHFMYSLIVKEKIFCNTSTSNTSKKKRRIKFLIACMVITLFDSMILVMIFIYRVFDNERQLFDQNRKEFVYSSIKSCQDDLNINIATLVATLWPVYMRIGSFCVVSIVILYCYRLVSILQGSMYQISDTQSNVFKIGFVSFFSIRTWW